MAASARTMNPGERFAILVGIVLLALAVTCILFALFNSTVSVACGAAPTASPTPTATSAASASGAASSQPAASQAPTPSVPSTSPGTICLAGLTFTATGAAGFFIILLVVLTWVWGNLKQAVLKLLGTFTSFGPYAGGE